MKGNFHVQFGIGGGEVALSADHTRNNDEEIAQNALSTPHEAGVKRQQVPSCGRGYPDQVNKPSLDPSLKPFDSFTGYLILLLLRGRHPVSLVAPAV